MTAPIEWSTGDPSIATVNSFGTVTADQPGTTSVTASWTAYTYQWNANNEYCDQFSMTGDGIASFTTQCTIPEGENTSFGGWDLLGTKGKWFMILKPSLSKWEGRKIYEETVLPENPNADTCHFPGSPHPKFNKVTNTPDQFWLVRDTNEWGPDTIGYSSEAVIFYRAVTPTRVPCGTRFGQKMFINCPNGKVQYRGDITIGADIGATTVSSTRDGQTETRNWQ